MVYSCIGAMVYWCIGAMVLVQWYTGALCLYTRKFSGRGVLVDMADL